MKDLQNFSTKSEFFKFLAENKSSLIAQKKYQIKKADAVNYVVHLFDVKRENAKAITDTSELLNSEALRLKLIINTTNILDSHNDVHIPGLWKKTLKEQKITYLLQEHIMSFDHIISDEIKAYTEPFLFKDLGVKIDGQTEALIFDCIIKKDRNPFMFGQYAKNYVKNHSVGMQYVNLFLCINSEEKYLQEEKKNWDKYISNIANVKEAEERGYFWAVTEAKLVEGSAVPIGSNYVTPILTTEIIEPSHDTQLDISKPVYPLATSEAKGLDIKQINLIFN